MAKKKNLLPKEIQTIIEEVKEKERQEDIKEARELVEQFRTERTNSLDEAERWEMTRNSVEEVFTQIIADLEVANKGLWLRSEYEDKQLGRATKGAAQGLLQKVYLYMASPYWHDNYLQKPQP